jgi:hypothetical protein
MVSSSNSAFLCTCAFRPLSRRQFDISSSFTVSPPQSTLLAKVWSGEAPPQPPLEDRFAWVEELYASQGDAKNTHHLGEKQWDYCLNLLKQAGIDPASTPVSSLGETSRLKNGSGSGESTNEVENGEMGTSEGNDKPNAGTLEHFIARSKAIYDDSSKARPAFPGAPDTYRQRRYTVTGPRSWEVESFHANK